jgi:hypothetical protein
MHSNAKKAFTQGIRKKQGLSQVEFTPLGRLRQSTSILWLSRAWYTKVYQNIPKSPFLGIPHRGLPRTTRLELATSAVTEWQQRVLTATYKATRDCQLLENTQ